jgi:hypothetical protein
MIGEIAGLGTQRQKCVSFDK